MQFGMPTLIELQTIEENASLCRELGLSFVEFNMDLPEYQIDRLSPAHLAETASKYGIFYTVHLEDTAYPWNFNKRVANAYTETVLRTVDVAKQLSVPVLNMHFHQGEYFTLPDRKAYLFEVYNEEFLRMLTAFRDACSRAVGEAAIKICVENTGAFLLDFVAEGIAVLLESPVFALTFDTGHNASGGFLQQKLIERHMNRLSHMHLHDYSHARGNHLPLGEGELDIAKHLDIARKQNCRVVLETKTVAGLRKSVGYLKETRMF
ncbi:MAG: sugar phosphate isomerase/epimerase [Clostridiales bacterium]|jgi:sugar phosphate isomerase/epimerase|nr:sugar phosphate isomerase/epimerase [Clostridiales bacterium]